MRSQFILGFDATPIRRDDHDGRGGTRGAGVRERRASRARRRREGRRSGGSRGTRAVARGVPPRRRHRGHRAVPAWRVCGGIGPARLTASHRVAHCGFAAGDAAGSGKNGDDEESDEGAEEGDEGDGEWEDALEGLPVEALGSDVVPDDQGAMADRTLPVYGITGVPTGRP